MKNDSKKAKARYLQNLVRDRIKKLFPKLGTEYKQIYSAYKQASRHTKLEPLLVVKRSREIPLAIISLEHFFNLLEDE